MQIRARNGPLWGPCLRDHGSRDEATAHRRVQNKPTTGPAAKAADGVRPPNWKDAARNERPGRKANGAYALFEDEIQIRVGEQGKILEQARTVGDKDAGCEQDSGTPVLSARAMDQNQKQRRQRGSGGKPECLRDDVRFTVIHSGASWISPCFTLR